MHRPGRFFLRDAPWGVAVPADPALAPQLTDVRRGAPAACTWRSRRSELIDELVAEYERASETVALSYAEDAELEDLALGGELHPFQRAGVRYALERRRTFIADEQGLGKTVQALATIEADDAFPAVVVCPASMKLIWERETQHWLPAPQRRRARRAHRRDLDRGDARRPRSSCSTTTSSTGTPTRLAALRAARADPGRVALREERARRRARRRRSSSPSGCPRTRCGSASPARRS